MTCLTRVSEKCRLRNLFPFGFQNSTSQVFVIKISRRYWIGTVWTRKGRSSHSRYSVKKGVLKNFANFTGKCPCWSLFLKKLQALSPDILLKRDSNTDAFLWSLRNFYKHLFWRTSANESFWKEDERQLETVECQIL